MEVGENQIEQKEIIVGLFALQYVMMMTLLLYYNFFDVFLTENYEFIETDTDSL